jgi:hypothetical protein
LFVAAITRTSTLTTVAEPTGSTSPSCSTRSTFACVGGHVADLVEEDRSAVGGDELAGLLAHRAGERALLVAEELRLDQLFGIAAQLTWMNG